MEHDAARTARRFEHELAQPRKPPRIGRVPDELHVDRRLAVKPSFARRYHINYRSDARRCRTLYPRAERASVRERPCFERMEAHLRTIVVSRIGVDCCERFADRASLLDAALDDDD